MLPIPEVSDVELAFPASPSAAVPIVKIPKQFLIVARLEHDRTGVDDRLMEVARAWEQLVSRWFFQGAPDLQLVPREGADAKKAFRAIRAVMGSYQYKHEHKTANVAYLFDEWFSDYWFKGDKESRIGKVAV